MRVLSFITCEDVRLEQGGKVSLMGVFDGLIVDPTKVLAWPVVVRVAGHLRLQLDDRDPLPDSVLMTIRFAGEVLAEGTAAASIKAPRRQAPPP